MMKLSSRLVTFKLESFLPQATETSTEHPRFFFLLLLVLLLTGCQTIPTAKTHYTIKQDPDSRPLERVVLLPVDVDVYEMSAGGIKEEVPDWSSQAANNIRQALLITKDSAGECCVSREVDSSSLTSDERETVEEHLALFNRLALNNLWISVPANNAWHAKVEHFDYTLGDGLSFLKTKYDLDAGLVVIGEDVVSSAGRKATFFIGAIFGVGIPMGHSMLMVGLVDFASGDLLWMNHYIDAGAADLRKPDSTRQMTRKLMEGYPGLQSTNDRQLETDD